MSISLKASSDGLSGTIAIGGVDKVTIGGTGITFGIAPASITTAELATAVSPLGVGQTWQNMLGVGGRAIGATITNLTGRPIQISIVTTTSAVNTYGTLTVGGVVVSQTNVYGPGGAGSGATFVLQAVVPSGATYSIAQGGAGSLTINSWAELR